MESIALLLQGDLPFSFVLNVDAQVAFRSPIDRGLEPLAFEGRDTLQKHFFRIGFPQGVVYVEPDRHFPSLRWNIMGWLSCILYSAGPVMDLTSWF